MIFVSGISSVGPNIGQERIAAIIKVVTSARILLTPTENGMLCFKCFFKREGRNGNIIRDPTRNPSAVFISGLGKMLNHRNKVVNPMFSRTIDPRYNAAARPFPTPNIMLHKIYSKPAIAKAVITSIKGIQTLVCPVK